MGYRRARHMTAYAVAAVVVCMSAVPVQGESVVPEGIHYSFNPTSPVGELHQVASQPGTLLDLDVFLVFPEGPPASFLEEQAGLFSAAVYMRRLAPAPSDPVAMTDASGNEDFGPFPPAIGTPGDPFGGPSEDEVTIFHDADPFGAEGFSGQSIDGRFDIPLGTISFESGSIVGETTLFEAGETLGASQDTVTWADGIGLQGHTTPASVAVTVVPTPSSAVAGGILLVGLGVIRPKRRRSRS